MKKKILFLLTWLISAITGCSADELQTELPENPTPNPAGKTLIVYYSFTNNIHTIATDLQTQIEDAE